MLRSIAFIKASVRLARRQFCHLPFLFFIYTFVHVPIFLFLKSQAQEASYGTLDSPPSAMTGLDNKVRADHILDDGIATSVEPGYGASIAKLQPPPLVAAMSREVRDEAEKKLRSKIDARLLPMIILMYIMNYLDRNNIAAVRLAGLQDELDLSSTQYQVCSYVCFI